MEENAAGLRHRLSLPRRSGERGLGGNAPRLLAQGRSLGPCRTRPSPWLTHRGFVRSNIWERTSYPTVQNIPEEARDGRKTPFLAIHPWYVLLKAWDWSKELANVLPPTPVPNPLAALAAVAPLKYMVNTATITPVRTELAFGVAEGCAAAAAFASALH